MQRTLEDVIAQTLLDTFDIVDWGTGWCERSVDKTELMMLIRELIEEHEKNET